MDEAAAAAAADEDEAAALESRVGKQEANLSAVLLAIRRPSVGRKQLTQQKPPPLRQPVSPVVQPVEGLKDGPSKRFARCICDVNSCPLTFLAAAASSLLLLLLSLLLLLDWLFELELEPPPEPRVQL